MGYVLTFYLLFIIYLLHKENFTTISLIFVLYKVNDGFYRMFGTNLDYFYSFRPYPGNSNPAPIVALCVKTSETGDSLDGTFRLATNGTSPVRLKLDLASVLGSNPLPGIVVTISVDPRKIDFKPNAWYTKWESLNEKIEANDVQLQNTIMTDMPFDEMLVKAKRAMSVKGNVISYRFEVTANPAGFGLLMETRLLPGDANYLNTHSTLSRHDVSSIKGPTIHLSFYRFFPKFDDLKDKIPTCPVVFSKVPIDEHKFRSCMEGLGLKTVLSFMICHGVLEQKDARNYVASPGRSVNSHKYQTKTASSKSDDGKKRKIGTTFDDATGSYHISKFGSRKPIFKRFALRQHPTVNRYGVLSLTYKTWDTYSTGINHLVNYFHRRQVPVALPVKTLFFIEFLGYLRRIRELQFSTIQMYVCAIKKWHHMNGASVANIECGQVVMVMRGIYNESEVLKDKSSHRCVITFKIMKLLGHRLAGWDMDPVDKQTVWCLFLFAFFGARRMGELVSDSTTVFDPFRAITWDKIRETKYGSYVIVFKIPKVSKNSMGHVVEFIPFEDKSFCPVANYDLMVKLRLGVETLEDEKPVFTLRNGNLICMKYVNELLDALLSPLFPNLQGKFTCHSFRAGLPSMAANDPDKFSREDTKIIGLWDSDCVDRYTRVTGEGRRKVLKKINRMLRFVFH